MTFISDTPNYTLSEFNTPVNKRTDYVSFIMNENETASISCRIHGGNPRPQLHIYQDSEDISDQFQRTESVNVVGKPGLQSVVHDIKLSADRFQVSADNRGDILKCVAKVTRFPHLKKTKSRELEVRCKYLVHFLNSCLEGVKYCERIVSHGRIFPLTSRSPFLILVEIPIEILSNVIGNKVNHLAVYLQKCYLPLCEWKKNTLADGFWVFSVRADR